MGMIDDMQVLILIDEMQMRQARHMAGLREKLTREEMNDDALAALGLMYSTGWKECIEAMRNMRSGR